MAFTGSCHLLSDVLCNRVAEAMNKRFFGDCKAPYTPAETPPKF